MGVRYLRDGVTPSYECNDEHVRRAGPTCQFIRGDGVDTAVTQAFLAAIEPAQLAVSLATLADLDAQARQIDRQWQLRLERARYEADLARRRVLAVEPEHRLVARSLERDWNEKLAALERLEREYAAVAPLQPQMMSPEERQRILALATDLPTLWHAPTTTNTARKQLLRYLIKDVTLTKQETTIMVAIRWQTGACTTCTAPRPPRSCDTWRTDPAVLARIREWAPTQSDAAIAARLTAEGYRAGRGGPITAATVEWLRWRYTPIRRQSHSPASQPAPCPRQGRYSARAAAEILNVDVSTIADWCVSGRLEAVQAAPHHPRWITLTPEMITALRKPVRQRKPRRRAAVLGNTEEVHDG
jgi:hypothetical protein